MDRILALVGRERPARAYESDHLDFKEDEGPARKVLDGLADAAVCFANAEDFRRRAMAAVDGADGPVRWLLLNVEANVEIDLTAADAVRALHQELTDRGVVLALARVKRELRHQLDRAGLVALIGPDLLFPTLPTAVDAFRARFGGDDPGYSLPRVIGPADLEE